MALTPRHARRAGRARARGAHLRHRARRRALAGVSAALPFRALPVARERRRRTRRDVGEPPVRTGSAGRRGGCRRWPSNSDVPLMRFRHVGGITTRHGRGVGVHAQADGGTRVRIVHVWDGPALAAHRRPFAATAVIGPVFVHGIASRTLAGLAARRGTTAHERRDRRLPHRASRRPIVPTSCVSPASSRRRSPASAAITPIGTGVDGAVGRAARASESAVGTLTRFDPSIFRSRNARAQVDDFDAADHLEAKRAKRLDRFGAVLACVARKLALEDAEHRPRRRGPRARRRDDGHGARRRRLRRGAGSARFLQRRAARGGRDAGARGVRRRGELQHRHRVRRARAPTPRTR